ncbi:MAG: TspO/MBR family protein [bacterium]|nr:TspO/MBR family protein [bacterium]MDZ4231417.1 TspO/MBR family protein [Patescibacteria group bacterium]
MKYLVIVLGVAAVSLLGSYFTSLGLMGWYDSLILPEFTPPGSFIGAVWTAIYILTAIAAALFYRKAKRGPQWRWVTIAFVANASLNVFWSYLFFAEHLIGLAILKAAALGVTVLILMYLIYPVSRLAALLLAPYAGWAFFATYLNYLIWTLN